MKFQYDNYNMIKSIFMFLLVFSSNLIRGQVTDTILISFDKSVYILTDSKNPTYDVGSQDYLVTDDRNGKIIIKASTEKASESNLLVQDSNKVYLFILKYTNKPKRFIFNYRSSNPEVQQATKPVVVLHDIAPVVSVQKQSEHIDSICNELFKAKPLPLNTWVSKDKILLNCSNIFVDSNYLYIKVISENKSKINYNSNTEKFYIRNKEGLVKQKGYHETEIKPVHICNPIKLLKGGDKQTSIYVFEKRTIDIEKLLCLELWEKNGDRNLLLEINNKKILQAKSTEKK